MKLKLFLIGFVLFQITILNLKAQIVFTKNDTINVTQDSLILKVGNHHGNVFWQYSKESENWFDLSDQSNDSLIFHSIDSSGYYRAKIVDGTCEPVYSDSVRVKPKMFDGEISLPQGANASNIVISSFLDQAELDSKNSFSMNVHTILFAFDTLIGKPVYIGYPGKDEFDNYKLDAKETALYFCLLTLPNSMRPSYSPYVKLIKEAFYQLPEVRTLENKIAEVVSKEGYLDTDGFSSELGIAINKILVEFNADQGYFENDTTQIFTKSAYEDVSVPTWNTQYHGFFRVSDEEPDNWVDEFNAETGFYTLKRNFFNSSQALIGVSIGKWNYSANQGELTDGYIGFLEPWFPPDMLTVKGNWDNLKQLGTSIYDMINQGFVEGASQTDAFSESNDFIFELKENEKDAFLFLNGAYDDKIVNLNIMYLFIDNFQDIFELGTGQNLFSDKDLINGFITDMINNPTVNLGNYTIWFKEGNYELIIGDIKKSFMDFLVKTGINVSKKIFTSGFEKFFTEVAKVQTAVYKSTRIISKIILNVQISNDKRFSAAIPVTFNTYGFPPPPINPTPFSVTMNNIEKMDFTWRMPQVNPSYSYNLYLSNSSNKVLNTENECLLAKGISELSYSLSTFFAANTSYYWRIEVVSSVSGRKTLGPVWYFKIGDQSELNQPSFSISPEEGNTNTIFKFDATNALGYDNLIIGSEFRWDFNGDGTWDTPWSNEKIISHQYSNAGQFTSTLQIKTLAGYYLTLSHDLLVNSLYTPTVSTLSSANLSQNSVTINGEITSDGGATVTQRGFYWSETDNTPDSGDNKEIVSGTTGSFSKTISGLKPNTTYYFRAFATNSQGTTTGDVLSFKTAQEMSLPTVQTNAATGISTNSGILNGNITSDGNATITQRGFYWSETNQTPNANDNKEIVSGTTGTYSKTISSFQANTTYYYSAFATNSEGTVTGVVLSFKTSEEQGSETGTFTDPRDGNSYKWVKIGEQIWMAENLAYLPAVYPPTSGSYTEPRYYIHGYYGSDLAAAKQEDNYTTYGVLYNWTAAIAACPSGWHLPTDEEWKQLEMLLGMTQEQAALTAWRGTNQGTQMKTTYDWGIGNGTNSVGFSALPGGHRYYDSGFSDAGPIGIWWSSTEFSAYHPWIRALSGFQSSVGRENHNGDSGYSVRCVRD
jgi:uncharacterized protein (TIGR02145 family)